MTEGLHPGRINRLVTALAAPVDAASSVVFRIGFGLIAAAWCIDDLRSGRVQALYIDPRLHFTYFLFDFVRPWPGSGMVWHFVGLLILAICISAGFLYRAATVLFATGFTYFFLLDRTNYQNHYYLLMLLSWMLTILPLNRDFAVDSLVALARPTPTIPAWCLWLIRFHVSLPYLFGGLAKLDSDWLAGEPLRTHLTTLNWSSRWNPIATSEVTIAILTWGGLMFDLLIVPLLLWRRTRMAAYLLCVGFHLTNAVLFEIHIFPWFMIFATTIFFAPDWPRRLLRLRPLVIADTVPQSWGGLSWSVRWASCLLVIYCIGHLVMPFRPFLYAGTSAWTERAHHFSWRMMMRSKSSAIRYYVTDPKLGKTGVVDLRKFVSPTQLASFSRDPEMILQLAHVIADDFRRSTERDVEVHALVLTTLNGRKPELLIDPNIDLAKEPRGFYYREWIRPQRESLRASAWSVPMRDWERHCEITPLRFLKRQ